MALRIFWVSPLPPVRSGVSDYAVEILGPLAGLAQLRILAPPESVGTPDLPPELARLLVPFGTQPDADERVVTHFGNNPYHQWIFEWCRNRRTVAVVHDLVLHHLLVNHCLDVGKDSGAFKAAMQLAHGASGAAIASARNFGLTGRMDPFLFPALKALLGGCEGLICHSEFGRARLEIEFPGRPILRTGLPAADPGHVNRNLMREKLGFSDREVVMAHLGFLTPEKGVGAILGGLAAARSAGINARLLMVGEENGSSGLLAAADALDVGDAVNPTGWLAWEQMITVPAAADVGVVLRVPSAGETSAAVLRFLACGTPVAVVAQRQFLEWPMEVVPRINPGPPMAAEIARLLRRISDDDDWSIRRIAARRLYEERHTPEKAARAMVEFLASLAADPGKR